MKQMSGGFGAEDQKKEQKGKTFLQDRSSESGKMLHWWSLLSLLACLSGVSSVTVHGYKGGSVPLPSLSIRENSSYRLTCGSKVAYGFQENEQYKGRVIESGHGLIIQDLKTTDAGKWTLSVHENGNSIYTLDYQIHVNDNLTGRIGEELVFDARPLDAYKVVRCKAAVCREMWIRGQGVLNDRLNDSNGRLSIREFRASDAGIYRVLNSAGGELVTVNVTLTVSGTESEGNDLNSTDDHRTDDTEQHSAWVWIVAPLALLALIILIIKKTRQHLKNKQPDSYGVEMGESGRALEYSFVTDNHENDHHNDGYRCISIPGCKLNT